MRAGLPKEVGAVEKAELGRERTEVPAQQQVLHILAGQASALLSQAVFDLRHLDDVKRLARTAALYGEQRGASRCGPDPFGGSLL